MCTAIIGIKPPKSSTRPGDPSPASALEATIQGGTNQNCGIMFFVFFKKKLVLNLIFYGFPVF